MLDIVKIPLHPIVLWKREKRGIDLKDTMLTKIVWRNAHEREFTPGI
jgi:hypothetical protein